MIQVENLTKRYGQHVAVDNISFTVNPGEILGFLGPNGAGKTTTMNILTGYISATEGRALVNGVDILEEPEEVKKMIGYLPEFPPLYGEMTVMEYLDFVSDIKQVSGQEKKQSMEKIMDLVKIGDVRGRLIKNLSKGYKQRVGLAQAMIGNPKVLILDEPTVGLDPKQIIEIRNLISSLGKDHTIILSSHILPEVSAVCERVIIINKGRIVASDTPENLSKGLDDGTRLIVRVAGPEKQVVKVINEIHGVKFAESQGSKEKDTVDVVVESDPDIDIRKPLFFALSRASYPILMMKSLGLTLEDIFLQVTTQEKEVR
ncbi:MAG TPA: ATP-binding cassette domain-containing protein [Candidatus Atribacteria bacterium]|nr:ATP-binding cassette domain-containing protein [Candidatus Atribacteria bacterium]